MMSHVRAPVRARVSALVLSVSVIVAAACTTVSADFQVRSYGPNLLGYVESFIQPPYSVAMLYTVENVCGWNIYCAVARFKQVPDTPVEFHQALEWRGDDMMAAVRDLKYGNEVDPGNPDCMWLNTGLKPWPYTNSYDWGTRWQPEHRPYCGG